MLICFSIFYRLTWGQRCWPRSEFGSVSVISSFILQDIPRHDTRIYFRGLREASKRTLLLGVRASISAYIAQNALRRLLGSPQQTPVYYIINALVTTRECCLERANIVKYLKRFVVLSNDILNTKYGRSTGGAERPITIPGILYTAGILCRQRNILYQQLICYISR